MSSRSRSIRPARTARLPDHQRPLRRRAPSASAVERRQVRLEGASEVAVTVVGATEVVRVVVAATGLRDRVGHSGHPRRHGRGHRASGPRRGRLDPGRVRGGRTSLPCNRRGVTLTDHGRRSGVGHHARCGRLRPARRRGPGRGACRRPAHGSACGEAEGRHAERRHLDETVCPWSVHLLSLSSPRPLRPIRRASSLHHVTARHPVHPDARRT